MQEVSYEDTILPEVQNHTDLIVWQDAMLLVEHIYTLTRTFPKEEIYGLSAQMRRAAISVPSNIAEGHTRDSLKDYLRFLSIALGSLAELKTQLILTSRLNFAAKDTLHPTLLLAEKNFKMLKNLQRKLKSRLG